MILKKFTEDELEELRIFDQKIEDNFVITGNEILESERRDKEHKIAMLTADQYAKRLKILQKQRERNQKNAQNRTIAEKEKLASLSKIYRKKNAQKIKEKRKIYYEANKDKWRMYNDRIKTKRKERSGKLEEKHKEKCREYAKKWREKNREKCREYAKKWREKNREKCQKYQAEYYKRKKNK